jgi:CRISPR-associated exonuclease Cas4
MLYVLVAAVLLILLGVALLWWGRRTRAATGLPAGEVVYSDTGLWQEVQQPLLSRRYGLVGRPDYLVQIKEGRRSYTVPVEVKSRKRPTQPLDGHVLQLGAYCLLVEDQTKTRPPYGLLRYADATLRIPFDDALRRSVLDGADAIRRARRAPDVLRQHEDPARCRGCGYAHACGEQALV